MVGFDDIPQASQVNPPLTTVRQPLEQMGRPRRGCCSTSLRPELPAQRVDLPTELIVRASTRPPRDGASGPVKAHWPRSCQCGTAHLAKKGAPHRSIISNPSFLA